MSKAKRYCLSAQGFSVDDDDDDDDDDNDDDDNDGDDDVLRSTPLLSLDVIVLSLLWKLSVLDMVSPGSHGNWPCS